MVTMAQVGTAWEAATVEELISEKPTSQNAIFILNTGVAKSELWTGM